MRDRTKGNIRMTGDSGVGLGRYPTTRMRRNRRHGWMRRLVAENRLGVGDLIWPVFVHDGAEDRVEIETFPGVFRLSIARLVDEVGHAAELGIPLVAIFPVVPAELKSDEAEEACNPDNLVCRSVAAVSTGGEVVVFITASRSVEKAADRCGSR